MPASARRPRPTRAYGLARRLAQGAPLAAVAQAAGREPAWLERLLAEPEFQELLAGWQDLLALAPDARTKRLVVLAHGVLEQALAEGRLSAALFTLAAAQAGKDPVVTLAQGIERALARAPAAPPAPPPAASPAPRRAARRDPVQNACQHAAAALRATIVREHGQAVADRPAAPGPAADPLGAAVHALHRAADAAAADRRPAAAASIPAASIPAPPAAARPDPHRAEQIDALTERLLAPFRTAGPAQRLALERMDDRALDALARTLRTPTPQDHPARPQGP